MSTSVTFQFIRTFQFRLSVCNDDAGRLGSFQFRRNTNNEHPGKRNGLPDIGQLFVDSAFQGNLIKPLLMNLNARVPSEARRKYVGSHGRIIIPLLKLDNRDRIILLAIDINVKPKIVPDCFDDPEDRRDDDRRY